MISKTLAGFVCGVLMILAWVIGTVLGGSIVSLPFDLGAVGVRGLVMCLLGGVLFSVGLGAISNMVLKKTSLE